MAIKSGLAAQLMMAAEVTPGTAVTPSKAYKHRSENIALEIDRLESEGIQSGKRVLRSDDWTPGTQRVMGDVELELTTKNWAFLFSHMLGTVATSGAGPYTHTATPGDLSGKSLTVQAGRPGTDGTVRAFTWAGMKVASWSLSASVDELALVTLSLVGMTETTATALASASYTSSNALFSFVHGSLSVAGSSFPVKEVELNGDNGLDAERFFLGQPTTSEPLEATLREYGGSLTADFVDLTAYNRFVNGTEAALVLTFTRGADVIQITTNVRFDGTSPEVGGLEILEQALDFKCVGASTDAGAITVVVTSSEASAA